MGDAAKRAHDVPSDPTSVAKSTSPTAPGAGNARMTGTGACVFAPFEEREEAVQWLADVPGGWQGFVARGLNRSAVLALV